ncbi:sensor histidine kinase, partial [Streptosporangium sp. NPDC001682]
MRAKSRWIDLLLPLFVGALQVMGTHSVQWWQVHDTGMLRVPLDPPGYALLLAGPLALAVRRRHPALSVAVAVGSTLLFIALGYAYGPVFLSPIIAFYLAVVGGHRRVALPLWGLAYVFFVVYTSWFAPALSPGWFHNLAMAALMGLVLAVAEFSRARNERQAEHERVEREEVRRQASEERLTMAQELHDVLAHNISLIHVQASTALHLIEDHPEQARTALTTIKQASKDVLTEMRSVLNVLRDGAPRSPTAGLDRLDELIERSGLRVVKNVTGEVRPLPPGVDRASRGMTLPAATTMSKRSPCPR